MRRSAAVSLIKTWLLQSDPKCDKAKLANAIVHDLERSGLFSIVDEKSFMKRVFGKKLIKVGWEDEKN